MMKRISLLSAIVALGLSGCGNEEDTGALSRSVASDLISKVSKRNAAPAADNRQALTQEFVDAQSSKIIRVQAPKIGLVSIMGEASTQGGYQSFYNQGEQSLTFKDGHLTASHGLPSDLIGRTGAGQDRQQYRYLTFDNQVATFSYRCVSESEPETISVLERSYQTTRTVQTCGNSDLQFINAVWRASNGRVVRSQQWHGEDIGYVMAEFLN